MRHPMKARAGCEWQSHCRAPAPAGGHTAGRSIEASRADARMRAWSSSAFDVAVAARSRTAVRRRYWYGRKPDHRTVDELYPEGFVAHSACPSGIIKRAPVMTIVGFVPEARSMIRSRADPHFPTFAVANRVAK